MSKSDGGLRALIRGRLGTVGQWLSIETGGTENGVPDMNVCAGRISEGDTGLGIETWIECKYTTGYAVEIRPEQVGFAAARTRRGGRVLFAVRRKASRGGKVHADELWLVRGMFARELCSGGIKWAALAPPGAAACLGTTGPATWDWHKFGAILTRPGALALR